MSQPQAHGISPGADTQDTSDLAREEGRQVADEAKQQAGAVAGTAKEQANAVAGEAMGHARDLAADAKQQLHSQAHQQTQALGGVLNTFGERVHALADGEVEQAGPVGDYAHRLAGQVDELAGKVGQLGFDGMIDEVQRYARRKPGAFLLGATVAGFAVSRLARGAQRAQQDGNGAGASATGATGGMAAPPPVPGAVGGPAAGVVPPPTEQFDPITDRNRA